MKTTDIIPRKQPTLKQLLGRYRIKNYTINKDGSVDVDGDVYLEDKNLTQIPIKFRYVSGNFNCFSNSLTTLQGAPIEVGGDFNCFSNSLTTLQGAPIEVGEDFGCSYNQLTSLKGGPRIVGGSVYCNENRLTTLRGAPKYVGRHFYCHGNKFTKEPDHSFIQIGGEFIWS